jgi:hypothetical protein
MQQKDRIAASGFEVMQPATENRYILRRRLLAFFRAGTVQQCGLRHELSTLPLANLGNLSQAKIIALSENAIYPTCVVRAAGGRVRNRRLYQRAQGR